MPQCREIASSGIPANGLLTDTADTGFARNRRTRRRTIEGNPRVPSASVVMRDVICVPICRSTTHSFDVLRARHWVEGVEGRARRGLIPRDPTRHSRKTWCGLLEEFTAAIAAAEGEAAGSDALHGGVLDLPNPGCSLWIPTFQTRD